MATNVDRNPALDAANVTNQYGFNPQASTAAANAAGGKPVASTDVSNADLKASIESIGSALASGNAQQFQESIREFNLKYANDVGTLYGQNFGPGQPAPTNASTLAAGQATGGIGYIPGFTGIDASQTQSNLAQQASTAQGAAGLTGFYTAPSQSQWSPGTFLRIDPSTYDSGTYGQVQLDYVLPSGQLQRVSIPQAQAMGWNGNLGQMSTVPLAQALKLEGAAPQQLPQQTLQGLTTYSNLNAQAQNQAIAQSGVTGMYTAPATVQAPGTDLNGQTFAQLPAATQQAYYQREGSDWTAAMNAWVNESNANIRQYYQSLGLPVPNQQGTPQETLAAQQQYATQAQQLAQMFGQYYQPLTPGQTGQAGVSAPQVGQETQAAIAQRNQIAQAWANAYGYVPQFDANGNPIAATGMPTIGGAPTTLAAQNQYATLYGNAGQAPQANQTTLAAQQQAYNQQFNLTQLASQLQANPFQQAQVVGQANRILSGMPTAGFSAPSTVTGVGTAGGNTQGGVGYLQQIIDDIKNPTPNQTTADSFLDQTPTPNKLDSASFLRSTPNTQNLILQAMQTKYGIDPNDALTQIKNTLPQFNAPATLGTVRRG